MCFQGLNKKTVDPRAYMFCALDQLRTALKRRDIFVHPSWRYADPRKGLFSGSEWEVTKPIIARTLGYSSDPKPVLETGTETGSNLSHGSSGLPNNPALVLRGIQVRKS